jgi:AcrR family transcriptional regulator
MSRKDEILAAFERLVARFGLDKVTMQDLAREVGISVGAIYLDFKNKEALIMAVEEKWQGHVAERNAAIVASGLTPEEKLHEIIVEHVSRFSFVVRENQAAFEMLMGALHLRYIGRKVADTRREILESMIESAALVMEEGRQAGVFTVDNVDHTARLFVEAFSEYFLAPEVIKKKHADVVKNAEAMFKLLLKAIETHSAQVP